MAIATAPASFVVFGDYLLWCDVHLLSNHSSALLHFCCSVVLQCHQQLRLSRCFGVAIAAQRNNNLSKLSVDGRFACAAVIVSNSLCPAQIHSAQGRRSDCNGGRASGKERWCLSNQASLLCANSRNTLSEVRIGLRSLIPVAVISKDMRLRLALRTSSTLCWPTWSASFGISGLAYCELRLIDETRQELSNHPEAIRGFGHFGCDRKVLRA